MFRIVFVSVLVVWFFAFSANVAYGQCGADGNQPCNPTPKSISPIKTSKANPTKKIVRSKSSSKTAAPTQTENEIKKTYALIIMENANLRESATVYSISIREVALNEKLLLVKEEPIGPWYKVFDSKTKTEGWLHGNTIEIVYGGDKNGNKRAPSEAVVKTQINICGADVNERVQNATETYNVSMENGDNETALQQLDLMKTALLQQRRCLNTGLRLKTITEQERAGFLDGLQTTKDLLEIIEDARKKLTQSPE